MAKVLLLFAHPALEKSRIHKSLIREVNDLEGILFHDLYELYPDFDIDVKKEQQLLLQHDIIIFQHPFYCYSATALIKQWQDLVLEHNWAYGSKGKMLSGKTSFNIISCGGSREAYSKEGRNRYSIKELMAPFDQTAVLCNMKYWPPFVIHGTHRLTNNEIKGYTKQYRDLLLLVRDGSPVVDHITYLNELVSLPELI